MIYTARELRHGNNVLVIDRAPEIREYKPFRLAPKPGGYYDAVARQWRLTGLDFEALMDADIHPRDPGFEHVVKTQLGVITVCPTGQCRRHDVVIERAIDVLLEAVTP